MKDNVTSENFYTYDQPLTSDSLEKKNFLIDQSERLRWELPSPMVSSSTHLGWVRTTMRLQLACMSLKNLLHSNSEGQIDHQVVRFRRQYINSLITHKMARVAGRYYWHQYRGVTAPLATSATTKMHPPRPSELQVNYDPAQKISETAKLLQRPGSKLVIFTGCQSLDDFQDCINTMKHTEPGTDFWLATSGHGFTQPVADLLKKNGLTGVIFELDSYIDGPFSEQNVSFEQVLNASIYAYQANLVIGFSLTVIPEIATETVLMHFAHLAKKLGASFIRVAEPTSSNVRPLTDEQQQLVRTTCHKLNTEPSFRQWPIAVYESQPFSDYRNESKADQAITQGQSCA